jgi:probable F420-dependent oxidoreductase
MDFGISMNMTWHGASVVHVAQMAERLGFESMWMGEHIIIPAEVHNPRLHVVDELPPEYRNMADPFIWLTAAAVATTRLRLGFNICLVPQRQPVVMAKQLACMDQLSGGRILFGAGAGWISEEAEAMGYPIEERWARTMDYLRAMKVLWTEEVPSYSGKYVSFPPIHCNPKPVQKPNPPILIGSGGPGLNNGYSLKRVAELADGWIPCFLSPAEMTDELARLRQFCDECGRDFRMLDISIVIPAVNLGIGEAFASMGTMDQTPGDARRLIADYAEAGVNRIVVGLVDLTTQNYARVLQTAAEGLNLV